MGYRHVASRAGRCWLKNVRRLSHAAESRAGIATQPAVQGLCRRRRAHDAPLRCRPIHVRVASTSTTPYGSGTGEPNDRGAHDRINVESRRATRPPEGRLAETCYNSADDSRPWAGHRADVERCRPMRLACGKNALSPQFFRRRPTAQFSSTTASARPVGAFPTTTSSPFDDTS